MFKSLIEKLKKVKDFRQNQGRRYELSTILAIIILAIMWGSTNYKEIDSFINEYEKKILKSLKMTKVKLPSYATIRRTIRGVNPLEIESIFQEWSQTIYRQKEELDWIAIDGKTLRNTVKNPNSNRQNMLTIVSLFSQESSLVLMSKSFETKKGSEIKQVQDMVRNCGLTKKVFTLDALHCNKQTTQAIIASENNYLITTKKNQIKLYNRLNNLAQIEEPLSINESEDLSHGRQIKRKVSVFKGENVQHKYYPHLQSFLKVERSGTRGKKTYQQISYYISSLLLDAEIFALKIRKHWLIENQLHWVKDVIFKEDNSKINDFQAANNFSTFVTMVLNLYRSWEFESIKDGKYWLKDDWDKIFRLDDVWG